MLSTPISCVHHWYWKELPTLQNWPITCQGGGHESRVPSICQLSQGADLGVSLGGCPWQGRGTAALTAEHGSAGAEPGAQPTTLPAGSISTAA